MMWREVTRKEGVRWRLSTLFMVVGATLYYGPLVFAVEATSQSGLAGFGAAFTSNSNQILPRICGRVKA